MPKAPPSIAKPRAHGTVRVDRPPTELVELVDELEQLTRLISRVSRRHAPLADLRQAWSHASADERRRFLGEIEV
jgi:hypothetical protein